MSKGARKSAKGIVRKKGKKNRKWKRNLKFCSAYRLGGVREKNKLRRLRRHLKRYPGDGQAARAVTETVQPMR